MTRHGGPEMQRPTQVILSLKEMTNALKKPSGCNEGFSNGNRGSLVAQGVYGRCGTKKRKN
jgi:hypothetical protein